MKTMRTYCGQEGHRASHCPRRPAKLFMANIRDPDIPVNLGAFRALQDEVRRLDALVEKLRAAVRCQTRVDQNNPYTAEELFPELFTGPVP